MKFQKYEKYKDSGSDWVGSIPIQWDNYRINWISTIIRGNTGFKKDELLDDGEYVALQYGKTYKVDEVNKTFKFFVNSNFYKPNQIVHCGNTILISTSETLEDLGHSCFYSRSDLGLIGGEQILLKPKVNVLSEKYLYYYSKIFCNELKKYATGLKVFRFNIDDLKNIVISIPFITEQERITIYLDKQINIINQKILLLKKKKKIYRELKQTLINKAVTRGLDKDAEMKDSDIHWIGEIPKHWKIYRVKDLAKNGAYYPIGDGDHGAISPDMYKEKGIPYIRVQNLTWRGKLDLSKVVFISKEVQLRNKKSILLPNDILIAKTGATVGKLGIITQEVGEANTTSSVGKVSVDERKYLPKFILYSFMANYFQKRLYLIASQKSAQPGFNIDDLVLFTLPIPSKDEQSKIVEYLDEKTEKIDNIIKLIDKNIDTLKEFRKTLINDAVTGKIKVV